MIISVIGDYASPRYNDFLAKVHLAYPGDRIADLSRHTLPDWTKNRMRREEDISDSHLVIIAPDFKESIESRRDVTYAQEKHRECLIYVDGSFRPFPQYAAAL